MVTYERNVTLPIKLALYASTSGYCSVDSCRKKLTPFDLLSGNPTNVGEIAHIVPLDSTDIRFDQNYPIDKLNDFENLILVCSNCHNDIDKRHLYSLDQLRIFKSQIEKWVEFRLSEEIVHIGFDELEIVCRYIQNQDAISMDDYELIPIQSKIDRNGLHRSEPKIRLGMSQVPLVRDYLDHIGQMDSGFLSRLKNGFTVKYNEGIAIGLIGDDLFDYLLEFTFHSSYSEQTYAAGLAVLTYYFEACDVFEK